MTAVTGRTVAAIAVAQGGRIRRRRVIQKKEDDEAKPLDMARWRGREEMDETERFHRQSALAGKPNAWSLRVLAKMGLERLANLVWGEVLAPQGSLEVKDHQKKPRVDVRLHWKFAVASLTTPL
jgi:hypothetical protein